MIIKFVTGSKNKFEEIRDVLKGVDVQQVDVDLPEIQSLDARQIIEDKLEKAYHQFKEQDKEFDAIIVEDTSLYLEAFDYKLPGPLIKWFLKALDLSHLADLSITSRKLKARAVTLIGMINKDERIEFFEGNNEGEIVEPKGDKDFGWGPIFKPKGCNKTYGEMEREEKHSVSMRGAAAKKMAERIKKWPAGK